VEVAPIIRKDIKFRGGPNHKMHTDGYETDNAYYSSEDKQITFLPQSKRASLKESNTPYWQIPMVASHEYGHNIFQTLILDNASSELKHSGACFQNHTTMKNSIYKVLGELRDNTPNFAMGSMNEGFADLIAFYAIAKGERKLTAVECFAKNREVESPVFGSGQSKNFNKESLQLINTQKSQKPDRDCTTPDYQEIHDVGALFAYGANYLISKSTDDKSKRLTIILIWAKKLATEYSELENLEAGEFLFASLELVLKATLQESSTAVFDKCALMDELFVDGHDYRCKYYD
jgi:hypothetical protein